VVEGGPFDVVVVPGVLDHLETWWDEPGLHRFVEALARFSRVIVHDRREERGQHALRGVPGTWAVLAVR
jgi:hypothetical protein